MQGQILILTQPDDSHACAVKTALQRKGSSAHLWQTADFPHRAAETVSFAGDSRSMSIGSELIDGERIAVVWNRRPTHVIDRDILHPADQEFAELNCRLFRKSLFDLLEPHAFWVNPHEAVRRDTKMLQLATAQELGLRIPETRLTNDPEVIRRFIRNQGGHVAYKPLSTLAWKDDETYWVPYTAIVREENVSNDLSLRAAPGIYQALVPKEHELRITVMGRTVWAVKILSQETESGQLDWRKAYAELQMEATTLPSSIEQRCIALLRSMGFVFGCFDFVVTPEGEHVFLEVNQMGQFLFLEHYTDLPLLDAFADFLISGSADFQWQQNSSPIRYRDVQSEVRSLLVEEGGKHVSVPEGVWDELEQPDKTV